ncbi:hypothetical protein [Luteolibacter luteus]|uniref:Uncharacterized protein n=1 Tax=Luteolibacter luteus TaxID=2728835 RepID=A0A858RDP1_9BACT|nr:hypothetical protein [Luteolibacter luteus]QJE94519.1 hypothetical protein HHL09_01540 [Luteolibacter luteus]
MRERTLPALITLLMISAARASDLATTFHFNHDLSREANPMVTVFGADAETLLLGNILGVMILVFIPLFAYWRFSATPLSPPLPETRREFVSRQLYGRSLSKREYLSAVFLGIPRPKNLLQVLRYMGIAVTWALIAASFHATFTWWALDSWAWQDYREFRGLFRVAGYPILELLSGLTAAFLASRWYWNREFASYLRHHKTA